MTVPCEKSKMFFSENIVLFIAQSRFVVNWFTLLLLGQHVALFVYLGILLSSSSIHLNRDEK